MPEATVPKPVFKEDLAQRRDIETNQSPTTYLLTEKGTALHEEESEFDAHQRIMNRVFYEMLPAKSKYDREAQECIDAYEGMMRVSGSDNNVARVFPIVFMIVDTKLSNVIAARPRVVIEVEGEKAKLPFIQRMYDWYTSDADDGVDEDVINYMWHFYNELVGWSIKRIWWEVEQGIENCPEVVRDEETDEIVMGEDGYATVKYERKMWRKGKVKQRVYHPDQVAVDPMAMFIHGSRGCDDIVFIEDIHYNVWSQMYRNNPNYQNTEKVMPGTFYGPNPNVFASLDTASNQLILYDAGIGLEKDKVRIIEYYCLSRDEYYAVFNGHKARHIANPTPPVNGRKVLPASDLHNRIRPGTFYSRSDSKVTEPIVVLWQRLLMSKARRAELAASPVVMTDMPSGIAPKSFKIVPGAHWRGMKGKVEVLNLAGVDTGEVDKYIDQLKNLSKAALGIDFERLIADPDPTAEQQLARDASARVRTDKDVDLQEKLGYVKSAQIMLAHLLFYIPIPEIQNTADLDDDDASDLLDWDKVTPKQGEKAEQYYSYAKIPVEDKMWVEKYVSLSEGEGNLELVPYTGDPKDNDLRVYAKSYFLARPEYLRTKMPVRVRIVSNRKRLLNAAVKLELAERLNTMAFNLPPKNEADIQQALNLNQPPPKPEFYIDRTKSVQEVLTAYDFDPEYLMTPTENEDEHPAQNMLKQALGDAPPTMNFGGNRPTPPPVNASATLVAKLKSKKLPKPTNAPPAVAQQSPTELAQPIPPQGAQAVAASTQ